MKTTTRRKRQADFEQALLGNKPLRPRGQWTLGDLLCLQSVINPMMAFALELTTEGAQTPIVEILSDDDDDDDDDDDGYCDCGCCEDDFDDDDAI